MKKLSFRSRLLLGFGSILLLFFLTKLFFILQTRKIANDIDLIYNHPFLVSNAVRDIQIEINEILYSDMYDVLQAKNEPDLLKAVTKIKENDRLIEENFKIINDRFLGDKDDIQEASEIYQDWKKIRSKIIELKKSGNNNAAMQFREQVGFPKATRLSQKFRGIADFAKNKAAEIYGRTKKTDQEIMLSLKIFSLLIFILSLCIALYISKSISSPIRKFVSEITQLLNIGNTRINKDLTEQQIFEITKLELSEAYSAIVKFNSELEQKITERTGALKESYEEISSQNEEITAQNEEISAQNEEYQSLNEEYKTQNDALIFANGIVEESEKKLNLALENGNIGTWEINPVTREITLDKRMGKMLNLQPPFLSISYETFEKVLHEEDVAHTRDLIKKALKFHLPFETVFRVKRGIGEFNFISAKAMVVKEREGNIFKMSGVCFDITDMKKGAEQVLFKLNEELLRSNQELQSFAYVASHDLKEPLRMVSNFTQLLLLRYGKILDQDGRDFIKFAVDGAKRMNAVINSLLEYSRLQSAGLNYSEVNMNNVVKQVCHYLDLQIKENGVNITVDDLPMLIADENQITHLFQNLLSNAIKFKSENPKINISSKALSNHYLFSVQDNGIGIDPQYFEKIFEIFKRLHTREVYEGTGIGLAFCKRIVERHDGKIWLESELGKGSIFYFTIPKKNNTP